MRTSKILICLIITLLLSSCSSYKIKNKGSEDAVRKMKKIALLNVFIFPPFETESIILQTIYSNIYEILPQLSQFHADYADTIETYMGVKLQESAGLEVLYGKNLYSKLTPHILDSLGIKTYTTKLKDNQYFPQLAIPSHSLNFSDFYYNIGPNLFENRARFESKNVVFSKLCDYLEIDGIVVAYVRSQTIDYSVVSDEVLRQMIEKVIFYNNKGQKIYTTIIESEKLFEQGNDIVFYKEVIDLYFPYTDAFLRNLFRDESFDDVLEEYKTKDK